jgi:Coenzyme PQQ synthesis protein D (PqqD)
MNDKRYVSRATAIAARVLGDETMVMSAADSTLFTLDEVATIIWEAADGATPLEEIVATRICTQFQVAPEVALRDAELFVQQLAQHGLLLCSDRPIAPPPSSPRMNP